MNRNCAELGLADMRRIKVTEDNDVVEGSRQSWKVVLGVSRRWKAGGRHAKAKESQNHGNQGQTSHLWAGWKLQVKWCGWSEMD